MYDPGKILAFGGSRYYETQPATNKAYILTIDEPKEPADVLVTEPMKYTRTFHTYAHFTPERSVPDTSSDIGGHREQLPPNNVVRVYHSIALLLRDGTVFTGGGGLCGDCDANHSDSQIYIPPYLVDSDSNVRTDRPQITSVASKKPRPSATAPRQHTVDTDQRRIAVELTEKDGEDNTYTFQIPEEPGIATPGYYMLFVLNDAGVPSVAENVQVTV
ncbi:galactose oxidase [Aspergillus terreus]|uniref:Galactose oxidase n=1 Tax=Aspergillus terreus TaxID=33178 RepID=A0A5M3Z9E1_ASPTE|nr:hypothetical protein ATETN484_0012018400 [Aspergillus terreus]GFF19432.1 galactose oxidase [Aspergillus terreus]